MTSETNDRRETESEADAAKAPEGTAGILSNVLLNGYVRCSRTLNGIPDAEVDADGIYCTTTNSTGSYQLSVPAGTHDLTATPPTGHAPRTYYDVPVSGTSMSHNFSCSHLSGTL
jgi:hypothetical protein